MRGGSDRIEGGGHRGHKDMYHRVARNIDVLNIHQLDRAARRAGRGMRPQRGAVDRMLRSSIGMAGRMYPAWASARSTRVGRA